MSLDYIAKLLRKLLSLDIKSINDFLHALNRLECCRVRFVDGGFGEDDQHADSLVQHPRERFVEDHLTQLLLNLGLRERNGFGDVVDLRFTKTRLFFHATDDSHGNVPQLWSKVR